MVGEGFVVAWCVCCMNVWWSVVLVGNPSISPNMFCKRKACHTRQIQPGISKIITWKRIMYQTSNFKFTLPQCTCHAAVGAPHFCYAMTGHSSKEAVWWGIVEHLPLPMNMTLVAMDLSSRSSSECGNPHELLWQEYGSMAQDWSVEKWGNETQWRDHRDVYVNDWCWQIHFWSQGSTIKMHRQMAYFEQVFQNLANTGKYDMMPSPFALCFSFIWYFFQSIHFFDINEQNCLNNLRRCFRPFSKEPGKLRMLQNRRRHEHLRRGGVVGCLERCKSVANLLENMDKFIKFAVP